MRQVADGVWHIDTAYPPYGINAYLVEDVMIDAGTRWAGRRVLRALRGRRLSMVALTHVHPDHQGTARLMCEMHQVPLACHADDAPVMEGRVPMPFRSPAIRRLQVFWTGPPHPVSRYLRDGDEVAGFRVVHAPGHTPGHVMFFRERDGVAIAGDVISNMNPLTRRARLAEPPWMYSDNPEENRRSIRKLLELRPSVICFGHGPPLHDIAQLRTWSAGRT